MTKSLPVVKGQWDFPEMVTNNHRVLDDRRGLLAIEQTRLCVVAIQSAGDDPVFATEVPLRDLRDVLKSNVPRGMYVRIRPSRVKLMRARTRLTDELDSDWAAAEADLGRPFSERQPYPSDRAYRVR